MLKKIFKHEWRTISPLLLAVHIVGLLVAVICRIALRLMGGVDSSNTSIMAVLLLFTAMIAIGCVSVYTYFYTGYRFYKSVFSQQGYLTNTLPVTADQLICGKGLTGVIWLVLTFLWAIICIFILAAGPDDLAEVLHDLPGLISAAFHPGSPVIAKTLSVSVLLTPFFMMIQLYVSAAIGNLFSGHKLLGTVGAYVGLYFLQQIVGILILVMAAPQFYRLNQKLTVADSHVDATFLNIVNIPVLISLVFSIVISAAFYILCRYVLNHRLNLE